MSFLKKQFKRHFQKNVSNFLSLWSSLTSITDLCIQSWVSYTAEIPKAQWLTTRVYFSLKLYASCGLAPCCIHSGSQDEGTPPYLCAFVAEEEEKWEDTLMGLKLFLGIPSLLYTNFTLIFWPKPGANGQGDIL